MKFKGAPLILIPFLFASLADARLINPKFEEVPPKEDEQIAELIANITKNVDRTRDAHPKAHGCMYGVKIKVKENLGDLAVGFFAEAGREFEGMIRSSSGQSNAKAHDRKKGGHGFALKIFLPADLQAKIEDIPGEKFFLPRKGFENLDPKTYYKSFDIITINGIHEFMVSTMADYPEFFAAVGTVAKIEREGNLPIPELIASIQKALNDLYLHIDSPDPLKKQRPTEKALMDTINQVTTHDVLDATYQSWVPSQLGADKAVKYQLRPIACEPRAGQPTNILKGQALMETLPVTDESKRLEEIANKPNRLRETLELRLHQSDSCYELAVHVLNAGDEKPANFVERAERAWPGRDAADAYKAVATITIPQDTKWDADVKDELCEVISMNPAHSLPENAGIGGIQRGRGKIYAAIETVRNTQVAADQTAPPVVPAR